jgi:imidazolonepropionase-like amidohydrolase
MFSCCRILFVLILVQLRIIAGSTVVAQAVPAQYLIKAGQLYDSEKNVFLKNQQILVKGNRIVKVGEKIEAPKGAVVLDYSHATVSPGLIDAHTHILTNQGLEEPLSVDVVMQSPESRVLRAAHYARTYLDAGFTTIRDLGNSGQYLDIEVRNAIDKGYIKGPRMLVSGPIIGSMDGQLDGLPAADFERVSKREYSMVSGIEEAIKAVKEHIVQGVDVIKIMAIGNRLTLSLDEMKAIVQTAHGQRLKVTAHCDRDWAAHAAIEAGVDGIEHGYSFKDTTLRMMAKKGIYLVPTYGSMDGFVRYHKLTHQEYNVDEIKKSIEPWRKSLLKAKELGVMIVAGSDAYHNMKIPRGEDAKYTLSGYYDYGFSAEDVLKTSTANAAIALEMQNEIGVIRENAVADITVFDGDLKKEFKKTLFNVKMVMKAGEIQYQK